MESELREAARRYANRDWTGTLEALHGVDSTEENHLDLAYFLGLGNARLERWDEALLYLEQDIPMPLGPRLRLYGDGEAPPRRV
jgi:hypothetical protein